MTDTVAVTWSDRNGNVYGPMTGSYTGTINAGHPEGYLSLKADTDVTDAIGFDKPLTATALDPYGNPAPGVVVHFAATGVNPQTSDVTTGADGKATFNMTGTTMGNDTVVVSATITTSLITLPPITVKWGTANGAPCTGRTTPLDVVLVIDASGSMVLEPYAGLVPTTGKLEAAQAAGNRFIDNLTSSRDQVSLVTFRAGVDRFAPLTNSRDGGEDAARFRHRDGHLLRDQHLRGRGLESGYRAQRRARRARRGRATGRRRPRCLVYIGDGGIRRRSGGRARAAARLGCARGRAGRRLGLLRRRRRRARSRTRRNDYFYAPAGAGVDYAFANLSQDVCRNRPPFVSAGGDQGLYDVRLPDILTSAGRGPR